MLQQRQQLRNVIYFTFKRGGASRTGIEGSLKLGRVEAGEFPVQDGIDFKSRLIDYDIVLSKIVVK